MNEHHDDLVERLEAFGRNPVPPAVQSAHLTAMGGAVSAPDNRKWFARLRVAGALMVGFLAGSTGLAAAGVEAGVATAPGEVIAKAAGVDIEDGTVTHGTERYYGSECVVFDGKGAKNRGQYLKMVRETEGVTEEQIQAAKDSDCGKPMSAVEGTEDAEQKATAEGENKGKGKAKSAEKSQKPEDAGADADDAAEEKSENRSDVADECAEGPDPAVAEDPATASEAAQELGDDKADCADGAGDDADAADNENGEAGKAKGAENKAAGQANKPADVPAAPAGS